VRISTTEWHPDGWSVSDSVVLARELKDAGVDLVDCSSGGNITVPVPAEPGYQVPMAERLRAESGVMTGAVGLITEPTQAEAILSDGRADAVLLGRAALREPNWPQRAAAELGLPAGQAPYPPQTRRGAWPTVHP
jgi:2,4-dienoyl-CoA reductase-like NADH-dependent reductase (Old Yellow Enzyme family)